MTKIIKKDIYVYLHIDINTGEVLYCGKGSRTEFVNSKGCVRVNDRAYMNDKYRKYKIDKNILVVKVKYFSNDKDAFDYETFLTSWYKKCNQCKYNDNIGCKNSVEVRKNNSGINSPKYKGGFFCQEFNRFFATSGEAVKFLNSIGIPFKYKQTYPKQDKKVKVCNIVLPSGYIIQLTFICNWK